MGRPDLPIAGIAFHPLSGTALGLQMFLPKRTSILRNVCDKSLYHRYLDRSVGDPEA